MDAPVTPIGDVTVVPSEDEPGVGESKGEDDTDSLAPRAPAVADAGARLWLTPPMCLALAHVMTPRHRDTARTPNVW